MDIRVPRRWRVVVPILLLAATIAVAVWWSQRDPGGMVISVANQTSDTRITVRIEDARGRRPEPVGELGPVSPTERESQRFERPEEPIRLIVRIESPGLSEGEPLGVWRAQLRPISALKIRGVESVTPEGRSIRLEGSFRLAREGHRDLGNFLSGQAFGWRTLTSATYTLDRDGDVVRTGEPLK